MKIDTLRQPLILTLLLFALLAILFCTRFLISPYPLELTISRTILPDGLLDTFSRKLPIPSLAILLLLVFSNALSISRLLSRNMVLVTRTYVPMTIYLVISCGIWLAGYDIAAAVAALLMIRASEFFIASFVRSTSFDAVFRGALLTGIIPLLHPVGTAYLLMVPIAMIIFRRNSRECVVAFAGAIMPTALWAYIMWIAGHDFNDTFISLWDSWIVQNGIFQTFTGTTGVMRAIAAGIIALLSLAGLVSFAASAGKMRTRAQSISAYAVSFLIVSTLSFLIPAAGAADMMFLAIPASMIIPLYFLQFPGWISGTSYIILLISVSVLNIHPLLFA